MWDFIWFMFFSTIEVVALISCTTAIFRFKVTDYIWPVLAVSVIMNVLSYVLRKQVDLPEWSPVVNLLLVALFSTIFLKAPLIWAFIMSIIGFLVYTLIQALIVAISFGQMSNAEIVSDPVKVYIMQLISGVVVSAIAYVLYKFGIGYAANFEKLRFRLERYIVLIVICIMTFSFAGVILYNQIYILILVVIAVTFFFLYYTLRKEVEINDSKGSPKNGAPN